jgi:hypothetical protein
MEVAAKWCSEVHVHAAKEFTEDRSRRLPSAAQDPELELDGPKPAETHR